MVLVLLELDGDLVKGATATLEIRTEGKVREVTQTRTKGKLPPNPELLECYQQWRDLYHNLGLLFRIKDRFISPTQSSLETSIPDCLQAAKQLIEEFNLWLRSESFRPLREKLLEKLLPQEETRLILQVEASDLRRLPWHSWDIFERYPQAELALGAIAYERPTSAPVLRNRVRILAVLGHRAGLDIDRDRALLSQFGEETEIEFAIEPQRKELYHKIWDEQGWDILFFAGHSASSEDGDRGTLEINSQDRLSLDELTYALKKVVRGGLKIAIFNSCDGLGLARQLEKLNIPQTIVMREPIPDRVAQDFLKHFLSAFSRGTSFYLSVREAREKLQSLEDKYPCATWLPVICQNPTEPPITWQELTQQTPSIPLSPASPPPSPYRGLSAFSPEDAPFFFGRERFSQKLLESLPHQPLLAVIGPSGSGKSSIIFAGLIPQLKNSIVVTFRPGDLPFFHLAEQLIPWLEPSLRETDRLVETNKLAHALQQGEISLDCAIDRILQKHPQPQRFLLVADQFEELYTLNPSTETAAIPFIKTLLQPIPSHPSFTLALTLRADFFEYALSCRPLAEALYQYSPLLLGPMNRPELQAAIEQPAAKLGVTIAEGLTERILDAIEKEPGNLPLLEFALTLLWEKQENGCLTHAAYQAIGGVEQALADYAERVYAQLNPIEQHQTQRIFTQLVRPGEGTADTRRVAALGELGEGCEGTLQRLADARLITIGCDALNLPEPSSQAKSVELVHEALLQAWQRLRGWIDDDRAFRTWQERSRSSMNQWESRDRSEGLLLGGTPLIEAQHWLAERPQDLSDREKTYITASSRFHQQERQAQMSFRRKAAIALTAAFLGSLSLGGIATWQWQQARVSKMGSAIATTLASAEELFASKKELDALLESIRAAKQVKHSRETDPETRIRVVAALHQAVHNLREYNRLEGHDGSVLSVRFSPDGQLLASGSHDHIIKIWQRDGREIATLEGHRDRVKSLAWSPDGNLLASASYDQTAILWSIGGDRPPQRQLTLKVEGKINSVEFSPDGQLLAVGDTQGRVKLWQIKQQGGVAAVPQHQWQAHRSWVTDVRFSPDGETLATASTDKTIKFWRFQSSDSTAPPLQMTLRGHQGSINHIAFSPEGILASAGSDRAVKVWHPDGRLLETLTGHSDRVWEVAWSPDGQTLASASRDGTSKLWHFDGEVAVATTEEGRVQARLTTLEGHNSSIYSLSFSPDGETLATASTDTVIKFWHLSPRHRTLLTKHPASLRDVAFSPNGQTLTTASADGIVKLWQRTNTSLWQYRAEIVLDSGSPIRKVNFSPDGKRLAIANTDGDLQLWQLQPESVPRPLKPLSAAFGPTRELVWSPDNKTIATIPKDSAIALWRDDGTPLQTFKEPDFNVMGLRFSPDGQMLAAAGDDDTVKIWQRNRQGLFQEIATLAGHTSGVWEVAWSPDGQTLASASLDGTIALWERDRSRRFRLRPSRVLKGHLSRVNSVSFAPNGRVLASSSADGTIKLWSLKGTLLKTLKGHQAGVEAVRFSPDGTLLVSASDDFTAIVWDLDLDKLLAQGCLWMQDYLKTNAKLNSSDRRLCKGWHNRD